jgi:hypothetical protein
VRISQVVGEMKQKHGATGDSAPGFENARTGSNQTD